jgi:ArsR family transcriptional regulator
MEALLTGLRAAAEPTRLRLLALCGHAELTVSELTQILGQSQPRVSRHLKLLCDAGLLDRHREGTWAFYRAASTGEGAPLARTLIDSIPADDATLTRDLGRLDGVKRARADAAAEYFRVNAGRWNEIRSLHVPEEDVEHALLELIDGMEISDLLDVGTGTGRILQLLGSRVGRGIGVDLSREMMSVARSALEEAGLSNCQIRLGDMYNLPIDDASMKVVTLHQVLHFADVPADVLAESARVLEPGGQLIAIDFAPHALESLREDHAHRRLGFSDDEVAGWYGAAGLELKAPVRLEGDPLTVVLWPGVRMTAQEQKRQKSAA